MAGSSTRMSPSAAPRPYWVHRGRPRGRRSRCFARRGSSPTSAAPVRGLFMSPRMCCGLSLL